MDQRISSLAPLSKCQTLRSLDISKSMFELRLCDLLHALRNLGSLQTFSLPQSVFNSHKVYDTSQRWPPNLKHLKFNGGFPCDKEYWLDMVQTWPPTLTSLTSNDHNSLSSGFMPHVMLGGSLPRITKLTLKGRPSRELHHIHFVEACPNLVELSLPISAAVFLPSLFKFRDIHLLSLRFLRINTDDCPLSQ